MKRRWWIEGRYWASVKREGKRLLAVVMIVLLVNSLIDSSGVITAYADTQNTYDENGFGTDSEGNPTYQTAKLLAQVDCQTFGISEDYIGYYAIGNAGQLNWFSNLVNGKLDDVEKNSAANAVLLENITAADDFEPISSWYSGTFDGRNHRITLNINRPDLDSQALFGEVGGGVIVKNVGTAGKVVGKYYTAGIIGSCANEGTILIQNCWNEATINGSAYAAGIFGSWASGSFYSPNINIENCYNTGFIKANKAAAIGGIMGKAAKFINCYNIGTIEGAGEGKSFYRDGTGVQINNCYQLNTVGIQSSVGVKTLEEFQSGLVCYLLNGGDVTEDKRVWYQNVDNDQAKTYPQFSGGKVYQTSGSFTNTKPALAITIVGGSLAMAYDGAPQELSCIKGTHITWEGTGKVTIDGYYMDNTGTVKTSISDSGAAYAGAAPVKLGSYYAKVSVTGDNNYLASTAYIPFRIVKEDEFNRLTNPNGEMVTYDSSTDTMNGSLIDHGWSGAHQGYAYQSVKDYSVSIKTQIDFGLGPDPTSVLSILPHSGNYYMGFGSAMSNMLPATNSCYQDVDLSKDAAAIDNNTMMFDLSGWLCATGGNKAILSLKQLDENKNVVNTVPYEASVENTDQWTKKSLSGAVMPTVRYLQVTITGNNTNLGVTAFDDLYLKVYSNEEAPPVIASIPDQTMISGKTLGPLSFVVGDPDNDFNTLTISASSSNTSLITINPDLVKLADGKGSISLSSVKGQTGKSTITITVSDGTKTVVRSFCVTVNPDVQMDTNLVVNGTGNSKSGWNDPQSRFSNYGAFQHNYDQDYYMDQNINIGKFSALIDAGFLTYTASCDVNSSGKMILTFMNDTGSEISVSEPGSEVLVPKGTRTIRVKIGGSSGCTIDNVSFKINSTGLPKITSINNQSINSSSTGEIPFTVGYAKNGVITVDSSNAALVPVSGISIGGIDYQRTIKVTPNSAISGSSTIKIMVDGTEVTSFLVTIINPITDIIVQSGSTTVTYGYMEAPKIRVSAQKAEGVEESKDITYQWYYSDDTLIENANKAEYIIPTGLSVGSHSYYCAVTCDWYTKNSDMITLTVEKATAEITIEENNNSYVKLVGEEAFHLSGITKTGDGTLTYSSSNTDAVTVDENGKITIVGEGEAVITVSMAETANYRAADSKTVTVKVKVNVPVTGISLDKNTLTLKARGAEATLTAAITPEDVNNKNITWSSSDTKVAVVADGVVTPLAHGTAIITVTTEEGNYSASCNVSVEASECPASYYGVQKRVNSETTDIRLIAMINTLEADEVGFVYSVSDKVPTIGKDGCNSLSNIEVYKTIKVNNESKKASELGGMGAYFIVSMLYDINAIAPEDTLYVCAYVKKDDVYTYTEVREITVSKLQ